ncbi:hypothetical protein ACH4FX_22450 [Streptomyces sp. NPDC018019]|uniref:hypothetical protein n=1 Tax=Streptomyces sp. NPDC018019 TaxID=3365030 RepID=UPI0037A56D39
MRPIAPKRAVLAGLTTLMLTTSLTAITTTEAAAINGVTCGVTDEYLKLTYHYTGESSRDLCLANAGEWDLRGSYYWATRIWTGNNRVQWFGNGRWQPEGGINKWTVFQWPNHPGGVKIEKIRIL